MITVILTPLATTCLVISYTALAILAVVTISDKINKDTHE